MDADIKLMRDSYNWPQTEKCLFDLLDESKIIETEGRQIIHITDELIDEFVKSNIPNKDFIAYFSKGNGDYTVLCNRYSNIIGNRVLARRGYPIVKDVLPKILEILLTQRDDGFNGIDELTAMFQTVPRKERAKLIRDHIADSVNKYGYGSWLNNEIEFLMIDGITKYEFENDVLWEAVCVYLSEERRKMNQRAEENNDAYYAKRVEYYRILIEYMSAEHL